MTGLSCCGDKQITSSATSSTTTKVTTKNSNVPTSTSALEHSTSVISVKNQSEGGGGGSGGSGSGGNGGNGLSQGSSLQGVSVIITQTGELFAI